MASTMTDIKVFRDWFGCPEKFAGLLDPEKYTGLSTELVDRLTTKRS